jgi:hypothetical protein
MEMPKLEGAQQEVTVTEPQPGPGPVPAQESPPYDKTGPKYPPPGEGEWPPKDAVDPHPLTPEDTRRPEKPAGMSVAARTYGVGAKRAELAEAQGKSVGQAPDVPNVPTGAIPVVTEDAGAEIDPLNPQVPEPTENSRAYRSTRAGSTAEPTFKATPPTGTKSDTDSDKSKDKK